MKRKIFLLGFILLASTGCKKMELNSTYRSHEVVIDGKNKEWQDELIYLEKYNLSIGLLNDDSNLYLNLITNDPLRVRQIMGRGLVVWFDPTGGDKKSFGVKFPIGFDPRKPDGELRNEPRPDFNERNEKQPERMKQRMNELAIVNSKGETLRIVQLDAEKFIEAKLNNEFEIACYELKIPLTLANVDDVEFEVKPGDKLGIGLEVPEFDRSAMRESRPDRGGMSGGPSGGMGGGRGGMGGGPGGGRGGMPSSGMKSSDQQNLKMWAKVQLATASETN